MIFTIEISHYPLVEDYEENIIAFIQELRKLNGVTINTNAMSTQIKGDHSLIMPALGEIIARLGDKTSSTILKIIPRNLPIESNSLDI